MSILYYNGVGIAMNVNKKNMNAMCFITYISFNQNTYIYIHILIFPKYVYTLTMLFPSYVLKCECD